MKLIEERKKSGRIKQIKAKVLVNVTRLTTGFDIKDIALGVTIRPSTSRVLVTQAIGRLVRTHSNKPFAELLDLAGWTKQFGLFTDEYIPPSKIGDEDKDRELKTKLLEPSLPNLELALDSDKPQELDLNKYNLIIKTLKAKEAKLQAKQQDITNWGMKELANMYSISQNHEVIIKIGVEIYRRKFGDPISKAGYQYQIKPENLWGTSTFGSNTYFHVHKTMSEYFEEYPHKKNQWIASLKTRLRNLIKQGEPLFKITGFIKYLAENYEDSKKTVYEESKDIYETTANKSYAKILTPIKIDITDEEIPF